MFQTLKNAWKVAEIKNKLLFTLLIVVLYRLGANIPVPYVTPDLFEGTATQLFNQGILQYLNVMSGDALSKATLFANGARVLAWRIDCRIRSGCSAGSRQRAGCI